MPGDTSGALRAQYLALRDDGLSHSEACGQMGYSTCEASPQRWERWHHHLHPELHGLDPIVFGAVPRVKEVRD